MTIPVTCSFCDKMSPYPNIVDKVKLEDKIYAYKLKCNDCQEEYWTLWNLRIAHKIPIYTDYVKMKKQYEDNQERLKELNRKAKEDVQILREQREVLLDEYKETLKVKRSLIVEAER